MENIESGHGVLQTHFLVIILIYEITYSNANKIEPDQTPQDAAYDLDLYCV